MKPFSALYFVKENKFRAVMLILMLFLGYGAYLGGLYVTNPRDNWEFCMYYSDNSVQIRKGTAALTDFEHMKEEVEASGSAIVLPLSIGGNGLLWTTIMDFTTGYFSLTFCSVEDFRTYCKYFDIDCDFDSLKDKSMIMSRRFAKNRKLQIGDVIDKDYAISINNNYTLDALIDEEGYLQYYINGDASPEYGALLLGTGKRGSALYDYIYTLSKKYPDIYVYPGIRAEIAPQFESFYMIYGFIVILLSFILAVITGAAFAGMYQQRAFEFALYRAIGIPKRRIIGKIIGELILMDVIALITGGCIFFLGLYIFNHQVLYPDGLYLRYYNPMALIGLIICNILSVVPTILIRCRQMLRADIYEF